MQAIRSILVVIEPDQLEGLALKRAQLIAGVTQSHLHLLVCEKRRDHSAALNDLAQELREEGYSVSTNQAWKDSLHQTIIAEQQAEGCGLIIKQHFPDNPLKKAILTPDDWKLLRFAPCPVLMTKTARPWTGGKILAAVDVGNNDGEHRSLHAGIISHAYDIAGLAKATLHVISAHPSPMLSSADPTFQLSETIEARYREACRTFPGRVRFQRRTIAHRGRSGRRADPAHRAEARRGGHRDRHRGAHRVVRRADRQYRGSGAGYPGKRRAGVEAGRHHRPPGGAGQQGVTAGRTKKPPKGGFFAGNTAYLSIACRNEGAM